MIEQLLPLALSVNTLAVMWLAGNRRVLAWWLGLVGQVGWLVFIFLFEAWGLLPLAVGLTLVYARNLTRWRYSSAWRSSDQLQEMGEAVQEGFRDGFRRGMLRVLKSRPVRRRLSITPSPDTVAGSWWTWMDPKTGLWSEMSWPTYGDAWLAIPHEHLEAAVVVPSRPDITDAAVQQVRAVQKSVDDGTDALCVLCGQVVPGYGKVDRYFKGEGS